MKHGLVNIKDYLVSNCIMSLILLHYLRNNILLLIRNEHRDLRKMVIDGLWAREIWTTVAVEDGGLWSKSVAGLPTIYLIYSWKRMISVASVPPY
jgi:hypothetical protein